MRTRLFRSAAALAMVAFSAMVTAKDDTPAVSDESEAPALEGTFQLARTASPTASPSAEDLITSAVLTSQELPPSGRTERRRRRRAGDAEGTPAADDALIRGVPDVVATATESPRATPSATPFFTPVAQSPAPAGTEDSAAATPADPNRPPRIAFVDVELIIENSQAIRQIIERVDIELAGEVKRIDDKRRDYRALQLTLDQQTRVLSDSERNRMRDQMARLLEEIDELQFRFDRQFRDKQRKTIEPVLDEVIRFIADVGAKEGYDLVLRGEVVLYGRESHDLTTRVLREIDLRSEELIAAIKAAETRTAGQSARPRSVGEPSAQESPLPLVP